MRKRETGNRKQEIGKRKREEGNRKQQTGDGSGRQQKFGQKLKRQ